MDPEQVKELLGLLSEKIPALLNSLTDVLYGKASAEKYGQAVANFYRTLKDSGMNDEQAFRLLGCRDYARVDFRVRPTGRPYILEVNPNPDFSPTAGLSGGLESAGLTHAGFTARLVEAALARGRAAGFGEAIPGQPVLG